VRHIIYSLILLKHCQTALNTVGKMTASMAELSNGKMDDNAIHIKWMLTSIGIKK